MVTSVVNLNDVYTEANWSHEGVQSVSDLPNPKQRGDMIYVYDLNMVFVYDGEYHWRPFSCGFEKIGGAILIPEFQTEFGRLLYG